MKMQETPDEVLLHSGYEADLEASIHALFGRCPRLHGFMVSSAVPCGEGFALPAESGLFVTEVSIYPACSFDTAVRHFREIAVALARLIDECPEAGELLRDRTFARVLH
jgi:hypothetical protein